MCDTKVMNERLPGKGRLTSKHLGDADKMIRGRIEREKSI